MKIVALGDNETLTALRLAGLTETYATKDKFIECTTDKEVGLILITEKIAAELSAQINEIRQQKLFPIIVEIPDKTGPQKQEDRIGKIIKRAVGVELGKEK
jgi:V/A-type H+-transporting ATPase subunit F